MSNNTRIVSMVDDTAVVNANRTEQTTQWEESLQAFGYMQSDSMITMQDMGRSNPVLLSLLSTEEAYMTSYPSMPVGSNSDHLGLQDSPSCSSSSSMHSINHSYDMELFELLGDEEKTNLQKKYKIPKPRILRNDFRRFYANMFVNVFNSCDYSMVNQHLHTYFSPNVGVVQADLRYDRVVHPLEIPMYQERALGLGYLGKFWYAGMCIAPDIVCSLRHTMLKVRSDGTSAIKCAFVLKGTMVSHLNDAKQADVEKIARYQKLRDSGRTDIRDITFTEAAMVAVAPPTIVAVPGGRAEVLSKPFSSSLQHNIIKHNLSSSTLTSSSTHAASPRTNEPVIAIKQETKPETKQIISANQAKTPMQVSCDSMDLDSASSEDNRSLSSTSVLSSGPARAAAAPSSRKRRSSATQSNTTHDTKRTAILKVGISSVNPSTTHLSHLTSQSRSPKVAGENSVLETAAARQIDWLSVAESAYQAGVLAPCQPHSAKEYYHSEECVPVSASDLLSQHISRSRSDDSTESIESSTEMDVVNVEHITSNQAPESSPPSAENEVIEAPVGRKIVLTAKLDCICSLELELDKDSVIVGVAVNYFR